ncbi:WD40-repeat-containing domain protein [Neohortaea acidophila]|uniref:WD40-repeat-containing domain protein n=1 Tax=Neohortaea acidophila TaxID=245834 RepID=A0A6A6PUC1_9PEZI|nr:WD40-repeat-containing domain protein [Neohortaea acidophila]KAF2482817.1 WD40-repeat-containing domain protein [Neohortaea acidophila]
MADQHEHHDGQEEEDDVMLDPDEAEEVIEEDGDAAMDSGDEGERGEEEIQLQNDSAAHFDHHKDSIFCIAQHPTLPHIVATGAGDDMAYVWDCTPAPGPPLPKSFVTTPQPVERQGQDILAALEGQDESVNAISFTLPQGEYIVTGTLAGSLNAYTTPTPTTPAKLLASAKEVEEVNWIAPCPHAAYPNTIAFGAKDGSVWVYTVNASDPSSPLTIVQSFFLHQAPSTAGAWTPDGKLLATVAEDSSLYVWDVFGEAAAAGVTDPNGGQAIIALTAADERFNVDGGLYSVAISPGGGIVAVGGAEGNIRVVGLPRLSSPSSAKVGGAKQAAAGQAGQILASLQAQTDGIETLDFSQPPLTLLAAGSVDGSIALYDAAHNFTVRRHIPDAHDEEAVIKVEFVKMPLGTPNPSNHLLTSCGNDGVVRRWDVRGGTAAAAAPAAGRGMTGEWKGHRGGGEGGGILGFVQGGGGKRIVTAGDDGVGLVFNAP